MGKKVKVGKARKDKYYQLAKDTGYRSRASFKLLQLNRKFEFLQGSNICIDLCAAPGGWLQVAQQYMPVSSIIIGVDLVPIKSIHGIITFQEDITTDKCRQNISRLLPDRKADLVLHDGAPNVGKNWLHDAYQQVELALQALKLATCFLCKGGYFITKVFRSKDYFALLWVFKQMFKKVHATKPQASRYESAEIFVVCQGYLAPDKIDPRFLDSKFVFKDVADSLKPTLNLVHPEKAIKKAEGYADDDFSQIRKLSATEFITSQDFLESFKTCTEIFLDDERLLRHPLTTIEIKECLKDIKVLGKKDLKNLLSWRKSMIKYIESLVPKVEEIIEEKMRGDEEISLDEDLELADKEIADKNEEIMKELKKKRKKTMKDKRKLRDKMSLNMVIPGDIISAYDDIELFDLKSVKKDNLESFKRDDVELQNIMNSDSEDDYIFGSEEYLPINNNAQKGKKQRRTISYDKDGNIQYNQKGQEMDDMGEVQNHDKLNKFNDSDDDDDDNDSGLVNDEDIDEIENGFIGLVDTDSGLGNKKIKEKGVQHPGINGGNKTEKKRKIVKLSPLELAIGEEVVKSKKRKRELIELSYNRYTGIEENAPDWFVQDEMRHSKKQLPVTKEQIAYYKEKQKAIDVNPIKKIAEAKARRKHKLVKRLEKARKKAESLGEDLPEKEKMKQAKEIYKKAGLLKKQKKEVTYVVAKKGVGKRVARPTGVKGQYKVVDPRMKKDNKMNKKKSMGSGKSKKGGKGKKGAGGKSFKSRPPINRGGNKNKPSGKKRAKK